MRCSKECVSCSMPCTRGMACALAADHARHHALVIMARQGPHLTYSPLRPVLPSVALSNVGAPTMICEALVCSCRCVTVLYTAFEVGLAPLGLTSIASTAFMSEQHVLGRECMTSLIFVSTT